MCYFQINNHSDQPSSLEIEAFRLFTEESIIEWHQSLPRYTPTPLISLASLADQLGVGSIMVKDEAHRFHLKAFKALGASYAIFRLIKEQLGEDGRSISTLSELLAHRDRYAAVHLCTATDGNHGRGVAWVASLLGLKAHIYMPQGSARSRIEGIHSEGADVTIVDGSYDDAVAQAARDALNNGWQIISDTAWTGYTEIPGRVIAGYRTLFEEIETQLQEMRLASPDLIFIQSGVGALAAAAVMYFRSLRDDRGIKIVNVEPVGADCLLQSARSPAGEAVSLSGGADTIMAGLNCGTPSLVAWPVIRSGVDLFLAVSDQWAEEAVRTFYYPSGNDIQIEAGESGAAGLAGLLALVNDKSLSEALARTGPGKDTNVLLINTEGVTDPVNFSEIVRFPSSR